MQTLHTKQQLHQNRRGIAILWLILWGGMFLTFFCVVLEISTLWQAHVEFKNSMDAAALAAVKDWGVSGVGPTNIPRNVGVAYAQANPILGTTFTPQTNLGTVTPANPNANDTNNGNFVFGAINGVTAPITFNGNAEVSCAAGDVTIRITDNSADGGVYADSIYVSFNEGSNLAIDSIKFILPDKVKGPASAFAYFDSSDPPQVLTPSNADITLTGWDLNGLDTEPSSHDGPPDYLNRIWSDPNNDGDIFFTFEDQLEAPEKWKSVRINFNGNSFTETDFFHFGVSTNQLSPSGYPSPYPGNVGEAFGYYGVTVEVEFRNISTDATSIGYGVFVDDPGTSSSEVHLTGGGGGFPAVVAQATVPVQGFCTSLFGVSFFNVSASSVAYYDCSTNRTHLVDITNFIFPVP